MKRIVCVLMVLCVLFCFGGCQSTSTETIEKTTEEATTEQTGDTVKTDAPASDSKPTSASKSTTARKDPVTKNTTTTAKKATVATTKTTVSAAKLKLNTEYVYEQPMVMDEGVVLIYLVFSESTVQLNREMYVVSGGDMSKTYVYNGVTYGFYAADIDDDLYPYSASGKNISCEDMRMAWEIQSNGDLKLTYDNGSSEKLGDKFIPR